MRADRVMADAEQDTDDLRVKSYYGKNLMTKQRMKNMLTQSTATRLSRDWATKTQHEVAGPGGDEPIPVNFSNMSTSKLRQLYKLQKEAMGKSG